MATKYAGQNSLNKLMSLIKNAMPKASTVAPLMDGTAAVGTSNAFARGDHVHPSDTAKVSKAGDTMTGTLNMDNNLLCGIPAPINNSCAANKEYVDGKAPYVVTATVTSGSASATMSDTRDNIKAKLDANIPVVGYIIDESGAVWEASVSWGGASILMEATMRGNNGTWHGHVDFSGTGATAYYYGKTVSDGVTSSDVSEMIASAISGVYTPKGTIAFASLPTASAGNLGWVYNISDAFTTTAAFVEGAGHSYGAGTNVVCVDAGSSSYKWDVLAGTIDLEEMTAAEVQAIWDSV